MLLITVVYFVVLSTAIGIILSNDDGWAEVDIRELYDVFSTSGHKMLVATTAGNKSGALSIS